MTEVNKDIVIHPADESPWEETRRRVQEAHTHRSKVEQSSGIQPLPEPGPTEVHSVREIGKGRRRK